MNKELLKIIITDKDLKKYNKVMKNKDGEEYCNMFSDSGMIIDELAFASKQWTTDELYQNNADYEVYTPYGYNYEDALFTATKTSKDILKLSSILGINKWSNRDIKEMEETKLQAGAYIALAYPEAWEELLEKYKEKLQEDRTEGISKAYNEQLQKEIDSEWDNLYKEWLYGDRNEIGVIKEIKKYWEAEDVVYNKKDNDTFIFFFDKEQARDTLENYNGEKLSAKNYKDYLLGEIQEAGEARQYKDKEENEKRKIERERLAVYKKEQATQAEAERKAKLLSMINKK